MHNLLYDAGMCGTGFQAKFAVSQIESFLLKTPQLVQAKYVLLFQENIEIIF